MGSPCLTVFDDTSQSLDRVGRGLDGEEESDQEEYEAILAWLGWIP